MKINKNNDIIIESSNKNRDFSSKKLPIYLLTIAIKIERFNITKLVKKRKKCRLITLISITNVPTIFLYSLKDVTR